MNTEYDSDLLKIPMINLHPVFLPFIGEEYAEYRLLHIGESHYIDQNINTEKYSIEYFKRWWREPCIEVLNDSPNWCDTRQVLINYMSGERGAYSIFNNFVKSFSKIVLKRPINSISLESKKLYKYISFMNFFQMPSLYEGVNFWNSLEMSSNKNGVPSLAGEIWDEAVANSINTVDRVIDIIEPQMIVFTSISAGKAYKSWKGKYSNDSRSIYTSHPGYPYTWCKKLRSLNGKRGIDVFEEALLRVYS